ncbi:MAG: NADH-quinone oxidoreductase subunit NuoE [Oscillospiraceae bacterium]|nr:NADH-quinone oxidoreductase subunit NuoE [Oscillospiraceae bacterium]
MAKRRSSVPFLGTAEQEEQLLRLIASHKNEKGALMPVLQQAQDIYGYLPPEVQKMIAEGLNIPLEEVYGVATFYGQFNLTPKGKYKISVCLGTACYVKGSGQVLERVEEKLGIKSGEVTADGKFSLDATRCLGACGLAPIMTINDDIYGCLAPADISGIIDKYLND